MGGPFLCTYCAERVSIVYLSNERETNLHVAPNPYIRRRQKIPDYGPGAVFVRVK